MRTVLSAALCGVSCLCLSTAAYAQDVENPGATTAELPVDADEQDFVTDEPFVQETDAVDAIIVTARRRQESVQEVPFVVNTVGAEDIAQLNLREFDEVEGLVPGLALETQGFSGGGSIRGVGFDSRVSGNNATVEFYLNDTPVNAGAVLQQMYDLGQIEVLRGPQGTLRGRASPSGSITVTTRKPDAYEIGGYVAMTGTQEGGINVNGAIGVPLIEGVLAVRAAGLYDISERDLVRTIADPALDARDPYYRAQSGRLSAVFEPTDWLQLEGMYQRLETTSRSFDQVESANIVDPAEPESPIFIDADDRLAIQELPKPLRQKYDLYTWKGTLSFADQNLIYTGGYREQRIRTYESSDAANIFPLFDFGQFVNSRSFDEAHELRLQNEDPIGGFLDYVVGVFRQDTNPPTDLINQTLITLPTGQIAQVRDTPIQRIGGGQENSVFGNLTFHIGDALEVSGGLRYLDFETENQLIVGGRTLVDSPLEDDALIYTASANYFLNPDVMVYASTGTSYRPGPTAIGDFSVQRSALQQSFTSIPPEDSVSYEVGLKSTLMNGDLRFNIAGFYQEFENYPYRSGGTSQAGGVYYLNFSGVRDEQGNLVPNVNQFNFIAAVPVEVYGVETEIGYEISPNWDVSLVAAYSKGEIQDGLVPCNDLDGDGVPDVVTGIPTVEELQDAYGDDYLGACTVSQRSGFSAPFSATLQSEYDREITPEIAGFVRGLFTYYGESQNDPQNRFDDVEDYGILNLYTGLRDPDGGWEISFYGKNILDVTKVVSRAESPLATNFLVVNRETGQRTSTTFTAPYRAISTTAPQEFGLNLRVAFGDR